MRGIMGAYGQVIWGDFVRGGEVCAAYTAQGHILMVFIGLAPPPLFFRAVYTAGAHVGHLKDMWTGDFGVILSAEGGFRVAYAALCRVWPMFSRLAPTYFFSCSVYCGGVCEASHGHVDGQSWMILFAEGFFVSHMLARAVFGWCFPAWARPIFFLCSVYCGRGYGVFGRVFSPCLAVRPTAIMVFRAGNP